MTRWFAGVMLVLALAGCGGGGGDVAATPGNSTIVTAADKGNIVISLTPGEATTAGVDAVKSALPAPTHVRVVVRNPTTNFKAIQDVATAGASSVVIPVPVGTGYLIDGLSYVTDGSSKRMLKHAQAADISVSKDANTPVSITLQPITVTITPSNGIVAGDAYTVTVTRAFPLKSFSYLAVGTSAYAARTDITNLAYSSGNFSLNAPTAATAGNLYFQGVFYIDDALTSTANEWPAWKLHYPDPVYGDPQIFAPFTLPEGGISVGITY